MTRICSSTRSMRAAIPLICAGLACGRSGARPVAILMLWQGLWPMRRSATASRMSMLNRDMTLVTLESASWVLRCFDEDLDRVPVDLGQRDAAEAGQDVDA